MSGKGRWRPLLDGEVAEQAWEAVLAVAQALRERPPAVSWRAYAGRENASLASGTAGLAVFFSYLADARPGEGWEEVAERHLDHAFETLASQPMPHLFYGGFSGVGWAVEHLTGRLLEAEEDEDEANDVDQALLKALEHPFRRGDYDLVGGLAGLAVYALEALPRPSARACLERVIDQLEAMAEEQPPGLTWFSPPEMLPEWQREVAPRGYYNLGVAHGVTAVATVLALSAAAGVEVDRCRRLLEPAMRWIFAQRRDAGETPDGHWSFPSWVAVGVPPQRSRFGWCYGDPGAAAALLLAARAVGEETWAQQALEVARRAAGRSPETALIRDAGL